MRFDKRGVGESRGAVGREDDLRFETYVDDAVAWLERLRRDPRFNGVAVIGHREGALIGTIAATRAAANALVLVSAPARPAAEVLLEQLATLLKAEPGLLATARSVVEELRAGCTVGNVDPRLSALRRPSVQPYLISWFRYDPAGELRKFPNRVLLIPGAADDQVNVAEARTLARARPVARLEMIEGMGIFPLRRRSQKSSRASCALTEESVDSGGWWLSHRASSTQSL